jgi:hypothetical protein
MAQYKHPHFSSRPTGFLRWIVQSFSTLRSLLRQASTSHIFDSSGASYNSLSLTLPFSLLFFGKYQQNRL